MYINLFTLILFLLRIKLNSYYILVQIETKMIDRKHSYKFNDYSAII